LSYSGPRIIFLTISGTLLFLSYPFRQTEIRVASAFTFMLDNIIHRHTGDKNLIFCEAVCCKQVISKTKCLHQ